MLLREPLDGAGKRSPGRKCGDLARSVTWRAFIPASVFRYRGRSRRSQGSLPQHVFRLVYARRSDNVVVVYGGGATAKDAVSQAGARPTLVLVRRGDQSIYLTLSPRSE